MQTLLASPYWVVREYEEHRLVLLRRTQAPFDSLLEVAVAVDQLLRVLQGSYESYGIVVDMRSAPLRTDAAFQVVIGRARTAMAASFARVAVLVQSHTGLVQVTRIARDEGSRAFITMSETAAFEFAKGLAVTNRRTKSAHSVEGPRIASPDPIDEASRWAKELDDWAMIREKVLSKIDFRSARRARSLASEIRRSADIALDVTERGDGDLAKLGPVLDELAALRIEAVELILGEVQPRASANTWRPPTPSKGDETNRQESGTHLGRTVRALDRASTAEQAACQEGPRGSSTMMEREPPGHSFAAPKSSASSGSVDAVDPRAAKSTR